MDSNKELILEYLNETEAYYHEEFENMKNQPGSVTKLKKLFDLVKNKYNDICNDKLPNFNEINEIKSNIDIVFTNRYATQKPLEYQIKVKNCCHMLYEFEQNNIDNNKLTKSTKSAAKTQSLFELDE